MENKKMKRSGDLTKEELVAVAEKGDFIYPESGTEGIMLWRDLDGTEARKYLESRGFKVIKNYDTGRNGLAITECGIELSTNGYINKRK